jgi:hypothetical protein
MAVAFPRKMIVELVFRLGACFQLFNRGEKPRVLIGRMADNEVKDNRHPALIQLGNQLVKVFQRTKLGVYLVVIHYVILMVGGRRVDGSQPKVGDAECFVEIVDFLGNAL